MPKRSNRYGSCVAVRVERRARLSLPAIWRAPGRNAESKTARNAAWRRDAGRAVAHAAGRMRALKVMRSRGRSASWRDMASRRLPQRFGTRCPRWASALVQRGRHRLLIRSIGAQGTEKRSAQCDGTAPICCSKPSISGWPCSSTNLPLERR
jgi:hypothetical protein